MLTTNPKQGRAPGDARSRFAYYAGYSRLFVQEALEYLRLRRDARVMDPWNGAGTTTEVADYVGHQALGFDLNPAAVMVAKARLLRSDVRPSHKSLAAQIVRASRRMTDTAFLSDEPLSAWFSKSAVAAIRGIERSIQHLLLPFPYLRIASASSLKLISPLAANYYVSLFRTVRQLLHPFRTSNPTWLRQPSSPRAKLRTSHEHLESIFHHEVERMFSTIPLDVQHKTSLAIADIGDSKSLPLSDESIDGIISSPPYCTRIDYAVAMKPELAVLGFSAEEFKILRLGMLGSTIMAKEESESDGWGETCKALLSTIRNHPAHGSRTYYFQTHLQYFSGLYRSLHEIARVLKPKAQAILVVQDSYYKEAHNDLPKIIEEMCLGIGLSPELRRDHQAVNTKAAVNTKRLRYRNTADATESVLVFRRPPTGRFRGFNGHQ